MRVAIYTRVSSEEQVQGTSLESQETICRQFADRNGYDVAAVFTDRGESAKTTDRKEFQAFIRYCRQHRGHIGGVVVWKTDRFARNSYDYAVYQGLLAGWDIRIFSATESNEDTPHGRAMRMITAVISQLDNDYRAERTKEAMRLLTNYGYWVHMAPLGYIRVRDNSGRPVLVEDATKAELVRHLFQMVADGCSIRSVDQSAFDLGLRSRRGRRLSRRDIHGMLRNPIYVGVVKTKLTGDREIKAKFPGLIRQAVWDRVQLALSGRRINHKPHERSRDDFPLRGLIHCGCCGGKVTASRSKGRTRHYDYYHCVHCGEFRVSASSLHIAFASLLKEKSNITSGRMRLIRHHIITAWQNRKDAANVASRLATENVDRIERLRAALLDKLLAGVVSDQVFRDKDAELSLQLAAARSSKHDHEIEDLDCESALQFADRIASGADQIWEKLSGENRQRFQQAMFPAGLTFDPLKGFRTADSPGLIEKIQRLDVVGWEMG